jgi:hypothetical protein
MSRTLKFATLALLVWSPTLLAQNREAPPRADQGPGPRNGRAPKLANPANVVRRLMQMTPEERERFLERLPPERQAQIRQRLEQFQSLPPAEQERRLQLSQMFESLPPATRQLVRRQIQAFNQLPPERRRMVGAAFQRLRRLSPEERQARMESPQFRNRFTLQEQQMLADLSAHLPPANAEPLVP